MSKHQSIRNWILIILLGSLIVSGNLYAKQTASASSAGTS